MGEEDVAEAPASPLLSATASAVDGCCFQVLHESEKRDTREGMTDTWSGGGSKSESYARNRRYDISGGGGGGAKKGWWDKGAQSRTRCYRAVRS